MNAIEKNPKRMLFLLVTGLFLLAWLNRFIQDDAFISFRYAQNLAEGRGLVWNPGAPPVEGYTNFLWTVMMAISFLLEFDVEVFAEGVSLASFVLSLVFTFRLARIVLASNAAALLAVFLLGTNYTFSAYATGGLETSLQTALFVACAFFSLRPHSGALSSAKGDIAVSLLFAVAFMTRPDSALLALVFLSARALAITNETARGSARIARVLALAIPFLVTTLVYLALKADFYGSIFPNTVHVKVSGLSGVWRGLWFLLVFLTSYFLVPFVAIAGAKVRSFHVKQGVEAFFLAVFVTAWVGYVIIVGGDFMEFRLLVPVLPLAFILLTRLIFETTTARAIRGALIATVLLGSLHHAVTFQKTAGHGLKDTQPLESIDWLKEPVAKEGLNRRAIGLALGAYFSASRDVTIATTAAGAIPFFSRLPTVDMHGLNDAWVARNGIPTNGIPGHTRYAPLRYLVEQKVNLVLGHPWLVPNRHVRPSEAMVYSAADANRLVRFASPDDRLPQGATLVEIPMRGAFSVAAIYLTKHPAVDAAILRHGWFVAELK